ncbi:MAG: hypothetical protein QM690_12400 [Sphingobium sp.]
MAAWSFYFVIRKHYWSQHFWRREWFSAMPTGEGFQPLGPIPLTSVGQSVAMQVLAVRITFIGTGSSN